jgi:D-alanine--D-alanine ligase
MISDMKILVLGGGSSHEREISLMSAAAVREALVELGHEVGYFDTKDRLDEVADKARKYDLVMPILHGGAGEDGTVQRELDKSGVAYLGTGAEASEVCFDKARFKELVASHGIPVARGEVVTKESLPMSELVKRPFVLKPVADGSSVDTFIERSMPVDLTQFDDVFGRQGRMLLEELIEGVEITVPVLGDAALPVIEIVPPEGKEFDFENKYNGATQELCPPEHVSAAAQAQAQRYAELVHEVAGCRHLSRTDFIIRPDDSIVCLETNTLPGMASACLFPKSAAAAGLGWKDLVARCVELAASKKAPR